MVGGEKKEWLVTMNIKDIKIDRNTAIVLGVIGIVAIVLLVVPTAFASAMGQLLLISQLVFFISATIWLWRHMK
jgi:UPF0716 family protein affecting phage T7 exclusion